MIDQELVKTLKIQFDIAKTVYLGAQRDKNLVEGLISSVIKEGLYKHDVYKHEVCVRLGFSSSDNQYITVLATVDAPLAEIYPEYELSPDVASLFTQLGLSNYICTFGVLKMPSNTPQWHKKIQWSL